MRALAGAFAYFSVLPVPRASADAPPDADALVALPLVGAVVGALAGAAAMLIARVAPHGLAAAVALGVLVGGTGAIHLDGFLDGCDAFFASVSPARRLEILRDPAHGTFALAGLLVAGVLWFAALASLPPEHYIVTLAFCAGLTRAAALSNAWAFGSARPDAHPMLTARPPLVPLLVQLGALIGVAWWLLPPESPLLVFAALVAALAIGRWIANRLGGGLTGDAYGFIIVVLEVALVGALAMLLGKN